MSRFADKLAAVAQSDPQMRATLAAYNAIPGQYLSGFYSKPGQDLSPELVQYLNSGGQLAPGGGNGVLVPDNSGRGIGYTYYGPGNQSYDYDQSGSFLRQYSSHDNGPGEFAKFMAVVATLGAGAAAAGGASAAGGGAGAAGAGGATTGAVGGTTGALSGTELGALGATEGGMGAAGAAGMAGAAGGGGAAGTTAGMAGVGSSVIPEGVAFTPATAAEVGGMAGGGAAGGGFLSNVGSAASSLFSGGAGGSGLGGWGSLIGPAASLVGGAMQANAAGNAADAMSNAAQAGIGEQRREFDTVRELLSPYVNAGNTSLGAYQDLSGANGPDKQRAAMAALEASPQFASMTKAGETAILQNAAATGGLRGGNVQGALYDHRAALLNGLQQQQLGNYLPIINSGQASAVGTGNAAMQTGTNVANLLGQQGAAQAGGIVAGSNAITNAIGGLGGFFAGQQAANVGGTSAPAPYASTTAAPQMGMTGSFGTGVVPGYGFQPRYF